MKIDRCDGCEHWRAEGHWIAKPHFRYGELGLTGICDEDGQTIEDYHTCERFKRIPWWRKILRMLIA